VEELPSPRDWLIKTCGKMIEVYVMTDIATASRKVTLAIVDELIVTLTISAEVVILGTSTMAFQAG